MPTQEQGLEVVSELLRHEAVEDEPNGCVDQGQQVHEFPEEGVAADEEALLHDATEEAQDALRDLGDQEQ